MSDLAFPKIRDKVPGESIAGEVVRLPRPGAWLGNYLLLDAGGETVAIPATAKKGYTVLETALKRQGVRAGETVEIVFRGRRKTSDGEREYRDFDVSRHVPPHDRPESYIS